MEKDSSVTSALRGLKLEDVLKRSLALSDAAHTVSSAAAAETPLTVLADIRSSSAEMAKELHSLNSNIQRLISSHEEERQNTQMMMAKMIELLADRGEAASATSYTTPSTRTLPARSVGSSTYYYGSWGVKTAPALLGCILYHLDSILNKHASSSVNPQADVSYMDPKAWASLVQTLMSSAEGAKLSVRLPKPSDDDFRMAAGIVASQYQGQSPMCTVTHLKDLCTSCPEIMSGVQKIIDIAIRCKGVLSAARTRRLSCTKYPFINSEDELVYDESTMCKAAPDSIHYSYAELKMDCKKKYVSLTWKGVSPPQALIESRDS